MFCSVHILKKTNNYSNKPDNIAQVNIKRQLILHTT